MISIIFALAIAAPAEVQSCKPPPGLLLPVSKCFVVQDTDGGMRLPQNHVLISEDGRRGFSPWTLRAIGSSFSVTEFASSRQESVRVFHHRNKPTIMTFSQWRDAGFTSANNDVISDVKPSIKLLSSSDADHVTVAHSAQIGNSDRSGITSLSLSSLDYSKNVFVLTRTNVLSSVMDVRSRLVLINLKGWVLVQPTHASRVIPVTVRGMPMHMSYSNDIIVSFEQDERPHFMWLQSIKRRGIAQRVQPPPRVGRDVYFWQTALLPGSDVLASFENESANPLGSSQTAYALYQYKRSASKWIYLGPFRLQGASNSGNFLLISGQRGNTEHYLISPRR
jgi:hypothetical protein